MKTVLITGCSSGFGFAAAKRFAAAGWSVLATLRGPADRPEAAALAAIPGVTVLSLDVTDPAQRAVVAVAVAGGLDCLINNAGYGLYGPLEALDDDQIRRQIATNLEAPILLTRDLLPALRCSRGRVINISSVLGFIGTPFMTIYTASKHGVSGFSEALRLELAPHGVQVCAVEPGRHDTGFNARLDHPVPAADSPYRRKYDRAMRRRAALGEVPPEQAAATSDRTADRLLRLAESRRMPPRLRLGTDAKLVFWVKRLIPAALFDRLMIFATSRGLN
ncbi:SDR family NAD(P)-dependent oxidoreductase [Mycobacterium sp. KBS0706]|uniref:SDR family NAD(P)-dependent oxidoreductase n=1 Tax=Mycobacterium sp. KBS0706 TaxID=2578109 RepID=UPI00110F7F07|nr:SDR family NAD(P)-dependent oxidoreductase [Mycobacterium sp. KBS0706]TSD83787.1 SDR family NAD(P)-dependent oxidoreductase [Mycobacterium sp. KBS0706]